eukprot:TRINITY_DN12277_c0_g2_i3.p3 TRINITY_DN12277_c0_g2~~TRINITY_DN12277_c0_g2_i3.p3  ORF type:complete len:122 (+),score=6.40 TRINITY_DN12277_c0_g2_i3:2233-2598(+)
MKRLAHWTPAPNDLFNRPFRGSVAVVRLLPSRIVCQQLSLPIRFSFSRYDGHATNDEHYFMCTRQCSIVVRVIRLHVQDGVVAETGTHDQLLASEGVYAEMWRRQLEADEDIEEQVKAELA